MSALFDPAGASGVPKVVLHDHLDGGLRPMTILELSDEIGWTPRLPSTDPAELHRWFVRGAEVIFGRKIDVVLHRAKCDLLTVKMGLEDKMQKIFIPVSIDANPHLRFTGKVATALAHSFNAEITVGMVVPEDVRNKSEAHYKKILGERIRELKIKVEPEKIQSKLVYSDYLTSGIVKAASGYDVVLLPAARGGITRAIGMGSIPEQVAKNCKRKTVIMAKGYRGIAQPFWDYVRGQI